MSAPLRLYASRDFLPKGLPPIELLFPFWDFNPERGSGEPTEGRYDDYIEAARTIFQFTEAENASLLLLPFDWRYTSTSRPARDAADRLWQLSQKTGIPVAIFYVSDVSDPVHLAGSVVFRTSLFASTRAAHEFAVPGWSEDFLRYTDGQLPIRRKGERPVVGFCGLSDPICEEIPHMLERRVRRLWNRCIRQKPVGVGAEIRGRALRKLNSTAGIDSNFIINDAFWAGKWHPEQTLPPDGRLRARQQYVANMIDSDYVLCARGGGNFSYRLFETLSLGRIPIFVNTNCVLPYEFDVPWKEYCVWIDESDIRHIGERVTAFHEAMDDEAFEKLQRRCRELWETKLSPLGFFSSLHLHLAQVPHLQLPARTQGSTAVETSG